jgi:hypothetical protein
MNISPKTYSKLLTIKIEPEQFDKFQQKVGRRNMSTVIRSCINKFLSEREDNNNDYVNEIFAWAEEVEKKQKSGLLNMKNDPVYNIEGFDFNGPPDFSINHDKYIYGL